MSNMWTTLIQLLSVNGGHIDYVHLLLECVEIQHSRNARGLCIKTPAVPVSPAPICNSQRQVTNKEVKLWLEQARLMVEILEYQPKI